MPQQRWTRPVTSEVDIDTDDVAVSIRTTVDSGWTVSLQIQSTIGTGSVDADLGDCGLSTSERQAYKDTTKKIRDSLLVRAGYVQQP
jgi:hypothetical protein